MKQLKYIWVVLLQIMVLACSSDVAPEDAILEVSAVRLMGKMADTQGAVLTMEYDNAVFTRYVDKEHSEYDIFTYQNRTDHKRTLMLFGEANIIFCECDSENDNMAVINAEDRFMTMFLGEYDATVNTFTVKTEIPLGYIDSDSRAEYNDGDDLRVLFKEKLVDKLASELDKWGSAIDIATLGKFGIGDFISDLGKIVAIAGNAALMDGAGTAFSQSAEETIDDEMDDYVLGKITDLVTGAVFRVKLKRAPADSEKIVAKYASKFSRKAIWGRAPKLSEISEDEVENETFSVFSKVQRYSPALSWALDKRDCPYELSAKATGITENSATFEGHIEFYQGYGSAGPEAVVLEEGFVYGDILNDEKNYLPSKDLKDVSVKLVPARKYYVRGYVNTLVRTWESPSFIFYTKGTCLEIEPQVITCSEDGGSYDIHLNVGVGAKWKIVSVSNSSMVKVTGSRQDGFSINVSASTKGRKGNIVVETESVYGEKEQKSIEIYQTGELTWDKTSWVFKWPANATDALFWGSGQDWDITITSVKDGKYYSYAETDWLNNSAMPGSGTISGPSQIYALEKGDDNTLQLLFENQSSILGYLFISRYHHIIKRIDEDNAEMLYHYVQTRNGKVVKESSYPLYGKKK